MEIYIQPPPKGAIVACRNVTYLLEKGRVVHQDPGERNYHMMYALALGAPAALRASLELPDDVASLGYLRDDKDANLAKVAGEWWTEVDHAIGDIGFGERERSDVSGSLRFQTLRGWGAYSHSHSTAPPAPALRRCIDRGR